MQHFLFKKSLDFAKCRRNFRIPARVVHTKRVREGEFSLILLNFAFRRQLLREARPLLETFMAILRLLLSMIILIRSEPLAS